MPNPYDRTTHDGRTVDWLTKAALMAAEKELGYPLSITQGSYNAGGVTQSAGTHDGGGVVDLKGWDADNKVRALRKVGFAAWKRTPSQGPWPLHVHACLIGNEKLAPAAARQVTAYLNGRNGLANNGPDDGPRQYVGNRFRWEDYLRSQQVPTTTVAAMALNAPRKERKGLLVNAAQVAAITAVARRRKVGIIMLQEVYAGQRRAWAKRRGWRLIEATPNNARGELGNAIAVRRRYARVLTQAEIKVPGPGYPLHFPVGTLQLKPYNSRLRGLVKQGWQMPTVAVCGAHFPRKTVLPFQARKAMAQAIARWVKGSEVPVIVGLDANDRRLFPHLGTESNVNHGIDGVGFTGEFTNAHGGAITNRGIRRITDHRHAVIGRARLRLSR